MQNRLASWVWLIYCEAVKSLKHILYNNHLSHNVYYV